MEAEDQAQDAMTPLEEDTERNAELARQMEEALKAAEMKMTGDQEAIVVLHNKVATLECEYERGQTRSRIEPSINIDSALEEVAGQI
ncbi:hypothetical protein EW146_g2432 [Bondarzewia mesenterica]|uniref:Uncharacterized protein n=1 Tax=Bondarzewia mesenterica TaxID=1095465 RepID=A0A4S4M261_9AGAM|nr:hypothetical protein EW146_g2432 [Bondarzewia mesenterica]